MVRICRARAGATIAAALDGGSKTDQKQADQLREALVFTGSAQVDEYLAVFLTDESAPRAAVVTKEFVEINPGDRRADRGGSPPHRPAGRAAAGAGDPRPHPGAAAHRDRPPWPTTGARRRSADCSTMTT